MYALNIIFLFKFLKKRDKARRKEGNKPSHAKSGNNCRRAESLKFPKADKAYGKWDDNAAYVIDYLNVSEFFARLFRDKVHQPVGRVLYKAHVYHQNHAERCKENAADEQDDFGCNIVCFKIKYQLKKVYYLPEYGPEYELQKQLCRDFPWNYNLNDCIKKVIEHCKHAEAYRNRTFKHKRYAAYRGNSHVASFAQHYSKADAADAQQVY